MAATMADFPRAREMAEQALSWTGEGDIEFEAGFSCDISPQEFAQVVAAVLTFPGAEPPVETVQLDLGGTASRRWEFVGADRIRAFMRRGSSVGPAADRVIEKKTVSTPLKLTELPARLRLKSERALPAKGALVPGIDTLKMRLKRRLSVSFPRDGMRVDMTVTVSGAGELKVKQREIEVESISGHARGADELARTILAYTRSCYCAMRGTSSPVTDTDAARVLSAYDGLTGETSTAEFKLVGPAPVTLTLDNVQPPAPGVVSVLDGGFTVTDKADGERRLLLVTGGEALLVDSRGNMARAFSGVPKALDGTLIDGELVRRAKLTNAPMRLFAAFDAYWVAGRSIAGLPLWSADGSARTRLRAAADAVAEIVKHASAIDGTALRCKDFRAVRQHRDVHDALQRCEQLPYTVDGLIFTPADDAAGARHEGDGARLTGRWPRALKWKPPSHNSVDFLVRVQRDRKTDAEVLGQRQVALPNCGSVTVRSKTLVLHAAYDPSKFEPIDPLDYLTRGSAALPRKAYLPKAFTVRGLPDSAVSLCAVDVTEGRLLCDDGDAIDDDTIVEFRWDGPPPPGVGGRWLPMRVRHDKTETYAKTGKISANNWDTAQSVFSSIRFPVSADILTGESPAPRLPDDDDSYFQSMDANNEMKAMRNFHNIVVKAGLYRQYGVAGGTLLEMACGRAGDLSRWLSAGFSLVVGMDKALDNIVAPERGAYGRWARDTARLPARPRGAFLTLDATVRMFAPHDELLAAAAATGQTELVSVMWDLRGAGAQTPPSLEPYRGVMTRGFDVVSCQFAVHYMFQTSGMLDRFIANVARMTRPGGVFVGTTFDGDLVVSALGSSGVARGMDGKRVMWSITCADCGHWKGEVGRAIDVFVLPIGKPQREYLVSFRTLTARMEAAGFELADTQLFRDAYGKAAAEKALPTPGMSATEKALSFLYRSFAFRKKDAAPPRSRKKKSPA